MNEKTQAPDLIDRIASGYQAAHVLLAANRLGVFTEIGLGALSVDALAQTLDADPRAVRILCDALAALDLLVKEDGLYKNSSDVLNALLPDSPQSKIAILKHQAKIAERWGKLYDTVQTGKPVPDETIDPRLIKNERDFALAMADVGRISAVLTADALDLSNINHMLDIGGGPGLYSIEFAKRNPNLHATIFDDEKTLTVARENIEKAGLSERITAHAGNALEDELGEDYDFILISNVIHIFNEEVNRRLVQKCANALTQGGRLCVKDFLLEPDRTQPVWCALFAVNMLVNTDGGNCYTLDEIKEWFHKAGLQFDEIKAITPQTKLVIGKKT